MGTILEIEVNVGRFMVYIMTQGAMRSCVNICIQEGKVAVSFHLHGELNVVVDTVQVVKEVCWAR